MKKSNARKSLLWAMLAYAVLVMAAVLLVRYHPTATWAVPVSLLPLVPGIFVVRSVIMGLGEMDELQRRIELDALATAFGGVFLLLLTETLLGIADIPALAPGIHILLMSPLWLLGKWLARRRYQ
jgi:hypothetical protein